MPSYDKALEDLARAEKRLAKLDAKITEACAQRHKTASDRKKLAGMLLEANAAASLLADLRGLTAGSRGE
jgi:hypothetical protein